MVDAKKLPLPPGAKQNGQKSNTVSVIETDGGVEGFEVDLTDLITLAPSLPPGLGGPKWTFVPFPHPPGVKTSDELAPSEDPKVCDCWKRVQIERMKTEWEGGQLPKSKYYQLCKWQISEPQDESKPSLTSFSLKLMHEIWKFLSEKTLAICMVVC